MRQIRGRDTAPEMRVRRGLHAKGLRFRLHVRSLPGRPDLVFTRYQTAAFVHGCFWHAHGCALSKLPATRKDFWKNKLERNAARDRLIVGQLRAGGWRVLVIWECAFRGPTRIGEGAALDKAIGFICDRESGSLLEILGEDLNGQARMTH